MMVKMKKSMFAWGLMFAFWMLIPQSTIGLVNSQPQEVVMSEQLLQKLEVMEKYRDICQDDSLCKVSKMNRIMDERKKHGVLAMLAGFAVSR